MSDKQAASLEEILEYIQSLPPDEREVSLPEGYELFDGKPMKVRNPHRQGWWRFHDHYDRDGYCDNPARGY